MKLLFIPLICLALLQTQGKKYSLLFRDNWGLLQLRIDKTIDSAQNCFAFTENEKKQIMKLNLINGSLSVSFEGLTVAIFQIVSPYTSETFAGKKLLLCDNNGRLRMQDPICIE